MRVKAIESMYYNRRQYKPGEEYEMDDREAQEANLLVLLGKIELVKKDATKAAATKAAKTEWPIPIAPQHHTTAVEPEPKPPAEEGTPAEGEEGGEEEKVRRKYYRRRDLRAE